MPDAHVPRQISARVAGSLVFGTSASILVLEILAGRLLAPYLGVTLQTFTGIIGTVLAGISLGSWYGGRIADQRDPRGLIGPILIAGGVLTLLAPTVVAVLGPALRGGGPFEIVLLSALAFLAPAFVLSAVSPVVVKIVLTDLGDTGAVVGRLSAIGTAGAIAGTFVTGFVLLGRAPGRPIILGLGVVLLAVGAAFASGGRASYMRSRGLLGLIVGGGLLVAVPGPCLEETSYACARVVEDPQRAGGRTLVLDTARNSYVDLNDPTYLEFRYAKLFGAVVDGYLESDNPQALYIGGGGFTFPQWFAATRPSGRNVVLEIDGSVVEIARAELGFDDAATNSTVLVGDARQTMAETSDGAFDVVLGDAFGGFTVPWHLTTMEFLAEMKLKMRPDGIYLLNLIDYPPLDFAKSEAATLVASFSSTLLIAPQNYVDGEVGGNFVFVASDRALDPSVIEKILNEAELAEVVVTNVSDWAGDHRPLRDDFAPVDQLITRAG